MSDIVMGALVAARDYLREQQQASTTYGYFLGGDPRDFTPDPEVCTPEELAAHKAACEAWDRGERTEYEHHRHEVVSETAKSITVASYQGAFGMGVTSARDEDAEDVLEQIDAALRALEATP